MTDKDTLLNLIDEYAEVRHINGCWVYNSKTASARQAAVEALSGVQEFPEPSSGRQAQSGAVYAELPDPAHRGPDGTGSYFDSFTRGQMRDFADRTHALRMQAAPKAAPGEPIAWTPGPNLFKDWCAQWFGPDSDDDYLAKAVFNLPPMAQVFKEAAPQQEAQESCPTCAALARTVMLDQVSFDRKPDCYGIRQITDDEGIEEWEDIRTSPDVAREEANDMMATGRGEIYEVVPLWTTPQPSLTAKAADSVLEDAARLDWLALAGPVSICVVIDRPHDGEVEVATDDVTGYGKTLREALDAARKQAAPKAAPGGQNTVPAELLEQAYREGWAACRDAETIGGEAEDWAFGNSTANSRMIDAQQAAPQQEVQEPWGYARKIPGCGWGFCSKRQYEEAVADGDETKKLYATPQPTPAELEQLRERISRMGLDVDRAMRGHVNEQSPLGTTRLAAIAALAKPAPAPLSDREEFERDWEKLHGKRPVLWDTAFKEAKMDVPAHSAGKYFYRDAQAAWKAWQARAALAAQGGKV